MKIKAFFKTGFFALVAVILVVSMVSVKRISAVSEDIASSSVTRYPVTYGSTTGTPIYNEVGRYNLRLIGNSNTLGYDRGRALSKPYYEYVDVDNDPATYNSSSMDYISTGSVKKAFLYIAQSYELTGLAKATRDNAFILGPSGGKFYFDEGYQDAYYDITDFIIQEGDGTYWGKNIDSERAQNVNRDNFANWEILIVEESPEFKYRNVVVSGFHLRMQNKTNTLNTALSSVAMASKDVTGQAILSSAGGNQGFISGSAVINSLKNGSQIGQTPLPSGIRGADLLQGRVTVNGVDVIDRNPADIPANIDLLTQDLGVGSITDGADNVGLQLTTSTDIVFLHMFGIAVDIGTAQIDISTYFDDQATTDKYFKLNDEVEVKNTIQADANEDKFFLDSPVVTIQLPSKATYVTNSVVSSDNPVSQEEYDANTNVLKLYFSNTITNNTFDFTYKIKGEEGVKVSDIETTLQGKNKVLAVVSDIDLTFESNTVTLYPSYPVVVNYLNESNGDTLQQDTLTGVYGDSFNATIASIHGFTFNSNANNSSTNGAFTDAHQTIDLYYVANIYKMLFDVNGGDSIKPDTQNVTFEAFASEPKQPTRTGYTFSEWNVANDGSDIAWDFTTMTMPANDVTLYAQWDINTYTASFDTMGGKETIASQSKHYDSLLDSVNEPTKDGYTFKGWNTASEGNGTAWDFTTMKMPANDVTLYAQWDRNSYQIKFDANQGEGSMGEQTFLFEQQQPLSKNQFTRDGYTFVGWSTSATGDKEYLNLETYTYTQSVDIVLYAVWKRDEVKPNIVPPTPAEKKDAPATGDTTNVAFLFTLILVTGVMIIRFYKYEVK